jgi:hypothetical protein
MKAHGTVWVQDVEDDTQFSRVVEQGSEVAQRAMKSGPGIMLTPRVEFLACSKHGDVYMVHYSNTLGDTASARLTQLFVRHGDRQIPLGVRD